MENINSAKISIKGMHCRSCELLVESNLLELNNIERVEVSHSSGEAIVFYKGEKPSDEVLTAAILKSGYEVGKDGKKSFMDLSPKNLWLLTGASAIIFGVLMLIKILGLDNISLGRDISQPGLGMVLLIGLVAGISTCMAIVGGIVLSLSAKFSEKHPNATAQERLKPQAAFIAGRVVGYAVLGGLLGLLGSAFKMSSSLNAILTMLVGALMLFIGLQLTELFPALKKISFSLPPKLAKALGLAKKQDSYNHKQAAIIGALTFFLPCGFTQAMQVYAISRGGFFEGAIIMSLFALGTAPGIFGIGSLAATVKKSGRDLFFRTAGIAIILFGLFNVSNAYRLLSVSDFSGLFLKEASSDKKIVSSDPNVVIEDGVQIVRMREHNRGYSPNKFTVKKGVPIKWIINAEAPYSCASALIVPSLKIQKFLEAGENIIEFTPDKVGLIKFSCSMGMYTGVFNVVE